MSNKQSASSHSGGLIETFAPQSNWVFEIDDQVISLEYLRSNEVWNRAPSASSKSVREDFLSHDEIDQRFYEVINREPLKFFDFMVEKCFIHQYLILGLGERMSTSSTDKLCRKIFAAKDLDLQFIEIFYKTFFPAFLKRAHSWFSVDLLVRASVAYPGPFKKLLQVLIKNTKVPNRVLQDYVVNINEVGRDNFMRAISEIELTDNEFIHHLKTINLAFLDSEKTVSMCEFIVSNLEFHASSCYNNRDYGKLLLTYLNNFDRLPIRQRNVRKLIEKHGSEYKSPCIRVFDEIVGEIVALQYQLQGNSRFFVQRAADLGNRLP